MKIKLKYFLLGLILLLTFYSNVEAQNVSKLSGEEIVLFTDRDVYIAGEDVWFKAHYLWDRETEEQLSNIIYVELFNANEKSLAKSKFNFENDLAAGTLQIPEETPTGNYFIRAYTRFQRNITPDYYFTAPLFIIHPDFPIKNVISDDEMAHEQEMFVENNDILINLSKEVYHPRELVEIEIEKRKDPNSISDNLSVSVVKWGTYLRLKNVLPETPKKESELTFVKRLEFLPEIRDVSISGKVIESETKEPVAGVRVYASVMFDEPQIHVYKTKEDGRFVFSLNHLTGVQDVFLCFRPQENKEIEMLVTSDFSNDYPQLDVYRPPFDSSHKQLLEDMLINWQLEKRFAETSAKNARDSLPQNPSLFGEDVITVELEDYIELSSLYEVFYEIIPYVRIKKKKGDYTISVRDPKQNIYYDQPMILVDYLPVFDVSEIMNIYHTKVEKIEVVNGIYMFGDHALWGVVSLETNTKNFGGIRYPEGSAFIEYQTVKPSQFFDSSHYESTEELNSRKPDFRNTLYWNPNVILNEGKTKISFYTSDQTSEYEIIVRGVDNTGAPISASKTIRVTK